MVLISKHWSQSHISNTTTQNCREGTYTPPMKCGQCFLSQTNSPLSFFSMSSTLIHSSCIKQKSWVFLNTSLHLFTLIHHHQFTLVQHPQISCTSSAYHHPGPSYHICPLPKMVFLLLLLPSQRYPPHSIHTLHAFALVTSTCPLTLIYFHILSWFARLVFLCLL